MQLTLKNANIRLWGYVVLFLGAPLILILSGCKKLVESEPPSDYVTGASVFSTDAGAISVLDGIYTNMNSSGQPFQGSNAISLYAGLDADELTLFNGVTNTSFLGHYKNALSQSLYAQQTGAEVWSPLYSFVFKCNSAIEGLQKSEHLTPGIKQQLVGEAKFLRAFFYFYLVNLFGDLPLVLTTDPEVNTKLARVSRNEIYLQIIDDLQYAENSLSDNYLNETLSGVTIERVRPTKWAASALLARVYLYTNEWEKAEERASRVINNTGLFSLVPVLNNVFLKNSREAIWQLQPTAINFNTVEAQILIIPQVGPSASLNPVFLSDTLINSFEVGDLRAKYGNWVDTTIYKITSTLNDTVAYANKYKLNLSDPNITSSTGTANMKEYFMVLRLGELYLIRAEARAQQENINGAKDDLNIIRNRAFAPAKPTTATDKSSLLTAILHEREVELFMEWGHRWLDLKRTAKIDDVMRVITPMKANAPWQSYQQLYPLPLISDILLAPNLVQNEGYVN